MENVRVFLRRLADAIFGHVPDQLDRPDTVTRMATDDDFNVPNETLRKLDQMAEEIDPLVELQRLEQHRLAKEDKKISIFISHAWVNSREYVSFVHCLNSLIGVNGWTNTSIPESEAIDFMAEEAARKNPGEAKEAARKTAEEATKRDTEEPRLRAFLEEELIRAHSRLRDPSLPAVSSRTRYYTDGSSVELETRISVLEKIDNLERQIKWLSYRPSYQPEFLPNRDELKEKFDDYKKNRNLYRSSSKYIGISVPVNRYPELSSVIRKRIECSDIVFVIVCKDLYLKDWVQFELNIAYEMNLITTSILFDDDNIEQTLTGYRSNAIIKYNDPDRDREIERLISKRVYELRPDRGSWRRETEGSAVSGGNDSEMAPQVPGIAQNGLGNGYQPSPSRGE